jgi:hypothetical protein
MSFFFFNALLLIPHFGFTLVSKYQSGQMRNTFPSGYCCLLGLEVPLIFSLLFSLKDIQSVNYILSRLYPRTLYIFYLSDCDTPLRTALHYFA